MKAHSPPLLKGCQEIGYSKRRYFKATNAILLNTCLFSFKELCSHITDHNESVQCTGKQEIYTLIHPNNRGNVFLGKLKVTITMSKFFMPSYACQSNAL